MFTHSIFVKTKMKMKEIYKHTEGLEATLENLFTALYSDDELNLIYMESDHVCENLSLKKSWIKVSSLVVPGVTNEEMVLIHLLWFQSIKRVVIYDVDPVSQAVLIRLNFEMMKPTPKKS